MIFGVGTDIVEVSRMGEGLARHGKRFAKRILAPDEFEVFEEHANPANFLAKRFAAKEALVKALGCGFRDGISMQHIVVKNDLLGKPEVTLHGEAAAKAKSLGVGEIFLSLADERDYAVAYVTATRSDDSE